MILVPKHSGKDTVKNMPNLFPCTADLVECSRIETNLCYMPSANMLKLNISCELLMKNGF